MALPRPSPEPTRILLLQTDLVASLHLRLAIEMSSTRPEVGVMENSPEDLRALCSSIRSGAACPDVIVVECDPREDRSARVLSQIGRAPELRGASVVAIGDGDEIGEAERALALGARAYIAKPERASELARVGREITRVLDSGRPIAG